MTYPGTVDTFTSVFKYNTYGVNKNSQSSWNKGISLFLLDDGRIRIRSRTNNYGSASGRPKNLARNTDQNYEEEPTWDWREAHTDARFDEGLVERRAGTVQQQLA